MTTWGSKCGISTYSEELCECLTDTGEVVLLVVAPQEEGSCENAPPGVPYRMLWNRGDPNLPITVPSAVEEYDVIHVQHEYGLFQNNESFIHMLQFLQKQGKKVVVTLHTVMSYGTWRSGTIDLIKSNSDAIITHTVESTAAVALGRGSAQVVQIDHGTRVSNSRGDRNVGLDFLNIPRSFSTASFGGSIGFMNNGKNLHETLKAWSEGVTRRLIDPSKCAFIFAGDMDENNMLYMKVLEEHKRDCGFTENIFFARKFIPREMMKNVMAVLDYAILNTTSNTLSASGQVHAMASHGVPFAAADRPIYRDSIRAGAVPFDIDPLNNSYTLSTVNAISALASNLYLRSCVKTSLEDYRQKTSWPTQAEKHMQLYKELMND